MTAPTDQTEGFGPPVPRLVLASASPRRREILMQLGLQFEVAAADVDEAGIPFVRPRELAIKAAFAKACAVGDGRRDVVVVAADTVVALGDRVYPKPRDEADARRILRELSGLTHSVITGLAVKEAGRAALLDAAETRVTFRDLSDDDILGYVATGEPMDKAGAYGVQGLGGALVSRIEGDFLNVVGLPVDLLLRMLAGFADVTEARRKAPEVYRTWGGAFSVVRATSPTTAAGGGGNAECAMRNAESRDIAGGSPGGRGDALADS